MRADSSRDWDREKEVLEETWEMEARSSGLERLKDKGQQVAQAQARKRKTDTQWSLPLVKKSVVGNVQSHQINWDYQPPSVQ